MRLERGLDISVHGEGRPLILLHSLLADRSVYDEVIPALSRSRRVIVPDIPGFGGSVSAGARMEDIADRIAVLFDLPEVGEEADVVGNGFGSFVALMLAIRHGSRFRRLALVGTGVEFPEQGKGAFRIMAEKARQNGMAGVTDTAILRLFPQSFIDAAPDVVAARKQRLLATDPEFFASCCETLSTLSLRDSAGSITNPTLVAVGELDAATPPAMARELATIIPGARLLEMPGAGHAPMAQVPDEFVAVISEFLEAE